MFNNDQVVAIKVNFKMAAAAILDFAGIEFWQQNGHLGMVFSPCIKFRANICYSDRNISSIKPIFKMAAAAILDFLRSEIWS